MTEILFYHLSQSDLKDILPNLIERSLARQWRVLVCMKSATRRDELDHYLWSYKEPSFLPHGCDGDKYSADQPVFLTINNENVNQADICFYVEGAQPENVEGFTRNVIIFDGNNEEELNTARQLWKLLARDEYKRSYWQQTADHHWQQKG